MKVAVNNLGNNAKQVGRKIVSPVIKSVRGWAIKRTEKRISESGVDIHALTKEELEILVCEEEEKLKITIQRFGMGAVMFALVGSP
jgi:hypothetical protein